MFRSISVALFLIGSSVATPLQATARQVDSTLVARYQLAETYLRAAQFDRAIVLLEDLVNRSPATTLFADRLREAYESVKRYDDALALLDSSLRYGRESVPLLADRARLLYLMGREDEALATWDEAVGSRPDQAGTYLVVMRSLMGMRLFGRAIRIVEIGRERTGIDALFRTDLAYLLGMEGRHAEAAAEYVALLAENPAQGALVRGRLAQHAANPSALEATLPVFERAVRDRPLDRPIREILAWLYMDGGRYREALDAHRAIDRLDREQGRVLFAFARQAADAAAWDEALEAYREILERYPDGPSAPEARAGIGTLHERRAERAVEAMSSDTLDAGTQAQLDRAVESYDRFLREYPGHPAQPEIRYRRARILLDRFFDLSGARAALEDLVSRHPSSPSAAGAAFDLGRIELIEDHLDLAWLRFSRLAESLRTGELAEAARYELARIHFFRGEFDAALALVESMKDNTSADVSNDAIALKLLLVENRGPDSLDTPLRGFARVRLLETRRLAEDALALADSVLRDTGDHPLLDELQYERAGLLRRAGRPEESAAAFAEISLVHPDSPLADRSLFAAAELYERVLGRPEDAASTYADLLQLFPGSLLAAEARARIRALRGDGT